MDLLGQPEETEGPVSEDERGQILALTVQLAEPELSAEARLVIAAQIRLVLLGEAKALQAWPENNYGEKQLDHPPPSSVFLGPISV